MALIEVNHVSKEFMLGQAVNLRHSLQRGVAKLRGRTHPPRPQLKVLDDVDFRVESGEVLGIIGTNGAGKSTLLKLLAGISEPTHGSVKVSGRIAPLIEVGAGLIGDLTGRENVYLNGIILGMSYRQLRLKMDEIVAFAELEEFIDTPIKRYSSGMAVRLGFSIATAVDADILIVDEVLAVGDLAFQRKCFDRMEDMINRQGKTVLLVSHNTRQVERLCSRVLLLDHGRILADDEPSKVCEQFYRRSDEKVKDATRSSPGARWGNTQDCDDVEVDDIALLNDAADECHVIPYKEEFSVRLRIRVKAELTLPTFSVGVHTTDFLYLSTQNSEQQLHIDRLVPGGYEIVCRVTASPLLPAVYALLLAITEGVAGSRTVFYAENLLHFQVVTNPRHPLSQANQHGFFSLNARWIPPRVLAPPAALADASSVASVG